MKPKISLSILSISKNSINNINKIIRRFEPFIDSVHFDSMDGKFVNNKSNMFPAFIKKIKTRRKKEAHLMIKNPELWIEKFSKFTDLIFIHVESGNINYCIKIAKKNKVKIGLAIKPKTDVKKIIPYIKKINAVMIMTVEPGKGGQKFKEGMLKKVKYIRKINKTIPIYVDGGINDNTGHLSINAGATHLVMGSYLLKEV